MTLFNLSTFQEAVNHDGEFTLAGRFLTGALKLYFGDESMLLSFHEGKLAAMTPGAKFEIMMDTRDRLEAVGKNIRTNGEFKDDGKDLFSHITVEELRACTTCNACVQECPVSISPLEIILELRRSLIMEDSNAPQEWNVMFGNIENNFAPWKFSPDDRNKWAEEMNQS